MRGAAAQCTDAAGDVSEDGLWSPRYRLPLIGALTVISVVAFETLAVSTAMPVLARDLHALAWYGLAFAAAGVASLTGLVVSGAWVDRVGVRTPILTGVALFGTGLVVAGLAPGYALVVLGRAFSGLGGGLQIVALYVLVGTLFPERLRPQAFSAFSAAWVVPSLVGPAAAGWITQTFGWRWVFLAVLPLAVLPVPLMASALSARAVASAARQSGADGPGEDGSTEDGRGEDDLSADTPRLGRLVVRGLTLSLGAALAQAGGASATGRVLGVPGWALLLVGLGVVAVVVRPLLPAGVMLARRGLAAVVIVRGLLSATFFGAETFIPLMLVAERGLTPTEAGLVVTAGAVGWSTGSFVQGRPWCTWPRPRLLAGGSLIVALSVAGLTIGPWPFTPPYALVPLWIISGIGMGIASASTSVLTLQLSAPAEQGRSSSALQLGDALGSLVGIGVTSGVYAAHVMVGQHQPGLYTVIWVCVAGLGLAAAVVGPRAALRG